MNTSVLLAQLESLLAHPRHSMVGTRLHATELHLRQARQAVERLRSALETGGDLHAGAEALRRSASGLHLAQPRRFALLLDRLEAGPDSR